MQDNKWFVLADTWIIKNFTTIKNEFYDKLYGSNVFGEDHSKNKVFLVPIENANNTYIQDFHPHAR